MQCCQYLCCCSWFKKQQIAPAYQKLIDDTELTEELINKILFALGDYNKPNIKHIKLEESELSIIVKQIDGIYTAQLSYENTQYIGKATNSYQQAIRTLFATEPEIPNSIARR